MHLTVEQYDQAEKIAEGKCCNRVIEASKPETFLIRGYPTRMSQDVDVLRYIDAMHELGEEFAYEQLLGGLTVDEFELFCTITKGVAELTQENYGHMVLPKGALARAFYAYRNISFISPPDTTVFEFGSGSGYLGLLLGLSGFNYAATEITQGFYLSQSVLWRHFFGDRFIELVSDERDFKTLDRLSGGEIVHVPWWKFSTPDADEINFQADVITANHAMCEMHTTAFKYALRLGMRMLRGPGWKKYFFIEGPGADDLRNHQQMCEGFAAAGFERVFGDFPIDIFSPKFLGVDLWEPSGKPATAEHSARRFFRRGPSQPTPAAEISKIEKRIVDGRESIGAGKRIGFAEIRSFQKSVMQSEQIFTDDERFLRFAYGTDHW